VGSVVGSSLLPLPAVRCCRTADLFLVAKIMDEEEVDDEIEEEKMLGYIMVGCLQLNGETSTE